ncbi:unnamed protein product [Discosporangium mesarthrocarpum]
MDSCEHIGPYESYVKQPPGFEQSDPNTGEDYVCKLKRSLYGLHNSSLNWFNTIPLKETGFTPFQATNVS